MFLENAFKTYFWQIFSFIIRIGSLFIITPFISSNKELFGVYTLCISLTMMFNYIDFGFLRSASKFCSEKYSENNFADEISYLGFGSFMTILFSIVIIVLLILFSIDPSLIIKGVSGSNNLLEIKKLFLILAISSPTYILHRIVQVVYEIRIKSFLYNRVYIIVNSFNIISAIYFFSGDNYNLIGYFITLQILNFLSLSISIIDIGIRYKYPYLKFISALKFDIKIFNTTKKIALSSILIIISWIIFIEIDSLFIINKFGAEKLAVFSIAFTFFTIIRFIFSTICGPFTVKFNYHTNDLIYLNIFIKKTLLILFPVFIIITINFLSISKNFVLSWVGDGYFESSNISFLFILSFTFSAISFVTAAYLTTIQDLKKLNIISSLQPVAFWVLVLVFSTFFLNLYNFIALKISIIIFTDFILFLILVKKVNLNIIKFLKINLSNLLLPLILITLFNYCFLHLLPVEKSKINLLLVISYFGITFFIGLGSLILVSKDHRKILFRLKNMFIK